MTKPRPIKLVILSHSSELGGAERSMIDLLDYWQKHYNVKPVLIIRHPLNNMVPELEKRGWKYHPVYYTNWSQRTPSKRAEDVYRNARENAKAVGKIEDIIKVEKPDLVMTNTVVSPWAAIAAHFLMIPHVWFVREYGDIDHQHVFELGRQKMYNDIDTLSAAVVTNSKTLANHVKEVITPAKVSALYTPFDLEMLDRKIAEKADNPFRYDDSIKLVVTGRIAPSKGQDEAAKSVGELNKQGHKVELCIIGTPANDADAEPLKAVIEQYDIADKVHLLGHQSNPLSVVRFADAGIMASQQEAFGRVTYEYMAAGKPVIGANSGATPELVVDGKTGYLYDRTKPGELTSRILKYAEDSELLKNHGQNARKYAEDMLKGENNADNLYKRLSKIVDDKTPMPQPLNFSRKWLDYPLIAQEYIDQSGSMSFRRIVKIKVRARLKHIYLKVMERKAKSSGN